MGQGSTGYRAYSQQAYLHAWSLSRVEYPFQLLRKLFSYNTLHCFYRTYCPDWLQYSKPSRGQQSQGQHKTNWCISKAQMTYYFTYRPEQNLFGLQRLYLMIRLWEQPNNSAKWQGPVLPPAGMALPRLHRNLIAIKHFFLPLWVSSSPIVDSVALSSAYSHGKLTSCRGQLKINLYVLTFVQVNNTL